MAADVKTRMKKEVEDEAALEILVETIYKEETTNLEYLNSLGFKLKGCIEKLDKATESIDKKRMLTLLCLEAIEHIAGSQEEKKELLATHGLQQSSL